jgi:hypothetical protein
MNIRNRHLHGAVAALEDGQRRLVATRSFSPDADELILHETPVIWAPQRFFPAYRAWLIARQIVDDPAKLRWIAEKHFAITPQPWDAEDQSFAQEIQSIRGVDPQTAQALYFSVATNHLAFWDETGRLAGTGLFDTLCYTNHSCAPNADVTPITGRRGTALRAIKAIAPGEEITWNYFSPTDISVLAFADRQRLIQDVFRFRCQCVRCRHRT